MVPGKNKLKTLLKDNIDHDDNIIDYEIHEDLTLPTKPIYFILLEHTSKLSNINCQLYIILSSIQGKLQIPN